MFEKYDGAIYRYIHSPQSDIVAIVDEAGNAVVEYKYDAWGKPIGVLPENGVGEINLFRYRGYVYDEETELYYLRSRYLNPTHHRFISRDSIISAQKSLLHANIFSYVCNTPILFKDSTGYSIESIIWAINDGRFVPGGIFIEGTTLHTFDGTYELRDPSKESKVYAKVLDKICTKTTYYSNSSTAVFAEPRFWVSLSTAGGEYVEESRKASAGVSAYNILNSANDGFGRAEMSVVLKKIPGNNSKALVTVQLHMNGTEDPYNSGMLVECIESSKVLTLISLTEKEATFGYGASTISVDYNKVEWLSTLIEGIKL